MPESATLLLPETPTVVDAPSLNPFPEQKVGAPTIRVLHLINGEHYSGAERVQDLLAARLPEFGFDVDFACVKPDRFPKMRVTRTARLYEVPMRSKVDLFAVKRLAKIVRDQKYQLLHAHTPRTVLIGNLLARYLGLSLVYHVHSPTNHDSTNGWRNRINAAVERFSLRGAAQLITVSNSLAETMLKNGFPSSQISVVPNGVPRTDQRRSESPPGDTWTLGAVALFRPRKGTEILLKAVARLRERGHDVRMLAVGPFETESYGQSLLDQTNQLGLSNHVEWTGFTRNVNTHLQRMDLFVLPSLFGEGLPMVVLEAMAAGVPVVGTDVEGIPEAIRDGKDGIIAKPGDPHDLARCIEQVISGSVDWAALRHHALQRQSELFSDVSMASGVAATYRRIGVSVSQ